MYQSWPWGGTPAAAANPTAAGYAQPAATAQVAATQWPAGYNQYAAMTPEMQQQWAAAWASQAQYAYGAMSVPGAVPTTTAPETQTPAVNPSEKPAAEETQLDKEEEEFEKQFQDWEKQFETWKEQNINHPDKEAFAQYEKQWQEWRASLLQKKEEMQKAKAERLAKQAATTAVPATTTAPVTTAVDPAIAANSLYYQQAAAQYMYMQPYMYPGAMPVAPPAAPQQFPYGAAPAVPPTADGGFGGAPAAVGDAGAPVSMPPNMNMPGPPANANDMQGGYDQEGDQYNYGQDGNGYQNYDDYGPPSMYPEMDDQFQRDPNFARGRGVRGRGGRGRGRGQGRGGSRWSDPNEGPQPGGPALLENPDFPGPAPGNFRGGPGDFPPGPDFPGGQGEFQDGGNEFPDKPGNFRGGPGNFRDGADFSEDFPPEDMPFPNEPGRQRNFGGGDGKQPLLSDRAPGPHSFPPNDMEGPPRPFDDRFPPDGEGFPPRNKNGRFMDRDFEGYPPDDFGPPPFRDDFPPFNDGFPPGRGGRFSRGGRGGRGRFNQGPDFDRFGPPPDFQNDGPFGPDDRFPFPGDRMGPGRGGMGPGRGGPGRGGPGRGGDRIGPGRGPRNFDPGFGPGGFPDDPFFREGRPPRRTIDYTHQSSEDFNPHYDYESEFQDDVTRFRDDFKTGVSMVPRDPIIFSQVGIESIDYGHGLTDVITTFVPPKKLEIKPPVKVFDYSHQRDMSPHRERDMPPHRERDMLMGKRDFMRPYTFPPRERNMFMRDRYLEEDDDEAEEDRNFDRVLDRDGNYMDEEDDNDYRDVDRDYRGDDRDKDYDRDDREKDRDYDRDVNRDKYRKENRDYDRDKGRDSKRDRDWDKDKVREDGDRGRDRSREDDKDYDRSREGPDKRYKWVRPDKDNKKSDSGSKKESNDTKSSDTKPQVPSYKSENKSESMLIEDILYLPKRLSRPKQLVIILRGLPGSGKTYFAKLIKDKEIENGGSAPRILSLDDYFMAEVEVTDTDPDTGKKIIKKEFKFEYEIGMEESYRQSLFKSFKKTIDDRFFPFIIVDAIHDKTRHYEQYWSYAKQRGFQVYIAEMDCNDPATCHKRNTHNRTLEEITKILKAWEKKPHHFMSIDVRSLLQEAAITEVEMEDDSNTKTEEDNTDDKEEDSSNNAEDMPFHVPSRWEKMETTEEKLYQLDGLRAGTKKHSSMEDYLQLPDDYEERKCQPGKKRVRWADLEERKEQDRIRAIGFVVGQTDWNKMTDPSHADRALTRTKYF